MASIFIICSVLAVFTCSSLDDPANGQVVTTGFEVGDTATYICNEGYSLQGQEMRQCQSNGVWSGSAPFCVGEHFEKSTFTYSSLNNINLLLSEGITCPQLVAPDNGQVFFRGVTVGSTARYNCLPGFVLQGGANRTCLSSGTWSGREPVCAAVNCPDLPDPANGEVTLSGITLGSTATYRSVLTLFFLILTQFLGVGVNFFLSSAVDVRLGMGWLESVSGLVRLTVSGLDRHQLARVRHNPSSPPPNLLITSVLSCLSQFPLAATLSHLRTATS